jgi:hypothetical protein
MNRYDALAERWRLQSTRTDELQESLRTHSYLLLNELATELGVEAKTWKEQKNPFHRRYVEYRLSPFPGSEGETRIDRYTPRGELEFAIVITFDHGEDTSRRPVSCCPWPPACTGSIPSSVSGTPCRRRPWKAFSGWPPERP